MAEAKIADAIEIGSQDTEVAEDEEYESFESDPQPEIVRGIRSLVYWVMAGLFFAFAMVGVVLPGIPTTPLLLLMCCFLIRVSPALHAKAMRWPVVGGPLRDWRDKGGVTSGVKVTAIVMVSLLVGSTLVFSDLMWLVKSVILVAAIYGMSVVLRLRTVR